MLAVKRQSDLATLSGQISPGLQNIISQQFIELAEALKDPDIPLEEYSLEQDGYIIIVQDADVTSPMNLPGFPGDWLSVWPEYIDQLVVDNGIVFRVAVLYDNDFMNFFYISSELLVKSRDLATLIQDNLDVQEIFTKGADRNV